MSRVRVENPYWLFIIMYTRGTNSSQREKNTIKKKKIPIGHFLRKQWKKKKKNRRRRRGSR